MAIEIGGELTPTTVAGILGDATTIIDRTNGNRRQGEINTETIERIGDKEYIAESDNGMGRVVLKKNQTGNHNLLTQSMLTQTNTIYVVQYDYEIGTEGEADLRVDPIQTEVTVGSETRQYYCKAVSLSAGETIVLTSTGSSAILLENNGTWTLNNSNTYTASGSETIRVGAIPTGSVSVVKYITTSGSITVPANCILKFDGGSISNGTINNDYILLDGWNFNNITFKENAVIDFTRPVSVPINNPKEFVETVLKHRDVLRNKAATVFCFDSGEIYDWEGDLVIDKRNVALTGGGVIRGHLHIGLSYEEYTQHDIGETGWKGTFLGLTDGQMNIRVSNLTFVGDTSKKATADDDDPDSMYKYLSEASIDNIRNISITLTNANNIKIDNCSFCGIPFPIVYKCNVINGTPTQVNQCVKRVYITNCDFDRCNTALKTIPSNAGGLNDFGDTTFSNNNLFPTTTGVHIERVDGFVFCNNTVCPSSDYNIYVKGSFEVIINGNELFDDHLKAGIRIDSANQLTINNNMFSGAGGHPVDSNNVLEIGSILLNSSLSQIISVTDNCFDQISKIPIVDVSPDVRTLQIKGNVVTDLAGYESTVLPLYYIANDKATLQVQSNRRKDFFNRWYYLGLDPLYKYREDIIAHYRMSQDVNKIPVFGDYRIKSVTRTKAIWIISVNAVPDIQYTPHRFMFDGFNYSISITQEDTVDTIKTKIVNEISDAEKYTITTVNNVIYIKAVTDALPLSDFIMYRYIGGADSVRSVYYNAGYNIVFRNVDGTKNITVDSPFADINDTNVVRASGGSLYVTAFTSATDTSQQITVNTPSSTGNQGFYIGNDTMIYYEFRSGDDGESFKTTLQTIVNTLYGDKFTCGSDGKIVYNTINVAEPIVNIAGSPSYTVTRVVNGGWNKVRNNVGGGYNVYDSTVTSRGTLSSAPTNVPWNQAFMYYRSDLYKPCWWNGVTYCDSDGVKSDVARIGTFANRPVNTSTPATNPNIPRGFVYFCTDKQTTEGATDGIAIFYKGTDNTDPNNPVDVWVDALGRTIS